MKTFRTALGTLACLTLFAVGPAAAVHPSTSYIFPAGGQRGTTVQVRIGGLYLHQGASLELVGDGVAGPERILPTETRVFPQVVVPQTYFSEEHLFPRDYAASLRITADAALGMRYWQVWTAQGGTPPRRFVIGDLPEAIEHEVSGHALAETVTLPITVNGRIYPREDVDLWSFTAQAGESITCEVNAARLGSSLDSHLEIRDSQGRRIAENTDHFGSDSFLRFIAPQDGTYQAAIQDVRFGGLQSSVYRLTITNGPHLDGTYPLGGQRGTNVSFQLLGQHVPADRVEVSLPADGPDQYRTGIPVAGTQQHALVELGDFPESLEAEPNEDATVTPVRRAPVVFNGRVSTPDDHDFWQLEVTEGQVLEFAFRGRRQGNPLNPLLVASDSTGKELFRTEARSTFTFPKAGIYRLRVSERFPGRGGPRFIYRLQVSSPATPDFRLQPAQHAITLIRGGAAELTVNAIRLGGFSGEIKLTADQLPEGVTATEATIPGNKKAAKLKLQAGPEKSVQATRIAVRGTAELPEKKIVTRPATYHLDAGEREFDTVFLTTALAAPFKFTGEYKIPFALRGTTHYRRYQLDRGGFEGKLFARVADQQIRHQMGTTGTVIEIPDATSQFDYPLQVSTWTKVGLTGRTVIMVYGELVDIDGSRHTVAYTSKTAPDQIMIQPSAGPISIALETKSILASADRPARVEVRIRRDRSLPLPVTLSVHHGDHMKGIEVTPVVLPPDQTAATLEIRFTGDAGPFNAPLSVRATIRPVENITVRGRPLRSGDPIFAEAPLQVVAPQR
ncbi:MAG: hypothetical protein CMJ75_15065 [Planctomycetaceae bacterium]|nr:hypothetical protein [Planctomycetaceae bacterium]